MNRKFGELLSLDAVSVDQDIDITIITMKYADKSMNSLNFVGRYLRKLMTYEAGQYCFLKIPAISSWESHPFSVSCSPLYDGGNKVRFHILSQGRKSWTGQLFQLAQKKGDAIPRIYFNGGYGGYSHHLKTYSRIFLVCGGLGVTPCISILQDMLLDRKSWENVEHICLVWIARNEKVFDLFKDIIERAKADISLQAELWVGRRALSKVITGPGAALVSGPQSLVDSVRMCGVYTYAESFML